MKIRENHDKKEVILHKILENNDNKIVDLHGINEMLKSEVNKL